MDIETTFTKGMKVLVDRTIPPLGLKIHQLNPIVGTLVEDCWPGKDAFVVFQPEHGNVVVGTMNWKQVFAARQRWLGQQKGNE